MALAQGHPGDTDPPVVSFSPAARTVYSPTLAVTIGFCDNVNLFSGTRQVTLNGNAVANTYTTGTQAGCTAYGTAQATLTLQPGDNTLYARICDGANNCGSNTAVYTYDAGPDVLPPTVQITPGTQTVNQATVTATITWCDERQLGTGRAIVVNGTDVTSSWSYAPQTSTTSCNVRATSTGSVTLAPGANTLVAQVQDTAGNWGSQTVTYTNQPSIDTSPTNQFGTAPQLFDAGLSYVTPAYRSLDADRSLALVYSSSQAWPTVVISVDVTDNSADPAAKASIQLQRNGTFLGLSYGSSKVYYATGAGTSRLTAWMETPGWATGSYAMTAVITRYWNDGRTEVLTTPVRAVVVNEGQSRYGAGWTIAGVERVVRGEGGIVVSHGDGSATFYPAFTGCSGGLCSYGHSPGVFAAMQFDTVNRRWLRTERDGTVATFDSAGLLVRVQDRLGNAQLYAYTATRLDSITDPGGKVSRLAYDGAGKLATITDPAGRVSTFQVNAAGDMASITAPDHVVELQPTYTEKHRITSYYDRGPRQWTFGYDDFGRLAYAQTPPFTAENGQTFRQTTYFAAPEQAEVPNWTAGTSSNPGARIDPATFRATVGDPEGRITRLALDRWGLPTRVEDPLGYVTTTARNAEGQVVSTVDEKGNTVSYTWDGGDLTRVAAPTGTVSMSYDPYGQVATVGGSAPSVSNVYTPGQALLDYSVSAGTDTTRYTWDPRGRALTVTDPEHHVTTYDYTDPSGWMNTRSVSSGGRTTYYRYDAYGRTAGVTNSLGRETTFLYDLLNRQRFITTPDGGVTEYVWGRIFLDRVNAPRGLSYSWTRNAMGWVESEVRPTDTAAVSLTYEYDRYGRTTAATNRRHQRVSVTYDTQDRVRTRTADGQTTTFDFSPDQPSNPYAPSWVAVSNPESTDTLTFDGLGRVTSSVSLRSLAGGIVQRYELQPRYDALGRQTGLVILQPGAVRDSVGPRYDPSTFRPSSMRDLSGGTTWFNYTRDGLPWQVTLPNAQHITQSFTSTHMLSSIHYDALGLNGAAGVDYEYDQLNRIQSRTSPNYSRAREYSYNLDGGWLSAYSDYQQSGSSHPTCSTDLNNGVVCTDPAATMAFTGGDTFAYDLSGNPTDHGAVLGAGDRLTQFNGYTLGYDPDGNLTSKTKAGYTQTLTWNSLGQLASVTTNGVTVSYGYDGLGKRVRRRINGADAGYLYDGDDLLLEYDGNGVQAKYAYYPSGEPHSVLRDGQTYYYATDVQGSVLALFNTSNTVVNQYSYLPFGEAQTATEGVANRLRYTGRELESESGLYYNNARWYDPQLHRFISEDPIGIDGGLDLYAYVGNDPVNFVDPFGLFMGKPKCPATAEEAIRRGQAYCLATLIVNGGWSGDELFWFLVSSASHNSAQGPIAGESLGPNSSSGHRYSRCEVAGILTDLVATLRQNPGSFFPHYNPRFDFRAGDENEHGQDNLRNQYQVGGVWLRSDQFGNFAAGYAGERVYGHAGWAAMRFGGFLYALWRTSNEDWLDLASASMINAGADRADQEAAASSTGTRGIGVVLRRPAPPVALTSRYGCRSK